MKAHFEKGSAILPAMLTVTLVATLAAAAIQVQWRSIEVEVAERGRTQAEWLMAGAVDWSRLILRQDAQGSKTDHLSEPWAMPLRETKVSTFIAANNGVVDADISSDISTAYVAGALKDEQSKFNLFNLANDTSGRYEQSLKRLFERTGLPVADADRIIKSMRDAAPLLPNENAPLLAQSLTDLVWYGVSQSTIDALDEHVSIIGTATKVNINTASLEALLAADIMLSPDNATQIIRERTQEPFSSLSEVKSRINLDLAESNFSTFSSYFLASGSVRIENIGLAVHAQLKRTGENVEVTKMQMLGVPVEN